MNIPSQETLRDLLICNEDTGEIIWRARGAEWFAGCDRFSPEARLGYHANHGRTNRG